MVLADFEIRELCLNEDLITPFVQSKTGNPSYGLSSYGYDLTLGNGFIGFDGGTSVLDPTDPSSVRSTESTSDDFVILGPKAFILAHTKETIKMPQNLIAQICDKSTLARCGIDVKNTVIEPGFIGQITLEITNNNNVPVKLYVGRGIAQILFFRGKSCTNPYNSKSKYQFQKGVTLPR